MQKNVRGWKAVSVLALGGMLLQFGGCLSTLPKNIWTGFGLGLGQLPAAALYDVLGIADFLAFGGDDEAAE